MNMDPERYHDAFVPIHFYPADRRDDPPEPVPDADRLVQLDDDDREQAP